MNSPLSKTMEKIATNKTRKISKRRGVSAKYLSEKLKNKQMFEKVNNPIIELKPPVPIKLSL
jgi:hypothetical protein